MTDRVDPIAIDSEMMETPGLQSAWVIPSGRPAVIDPGPANRAVEVDRKIRELGIERLDSIVLTHIHFDHAGGAAALARLNPGARIFIHPRVAGLLVDPTPLIAAVTGVWGPDTGELFGLPEPAPEESVVAVGEGETIELGAGRHLEVLETPGHTRAHLAFVDRTADGIFCGDAVAIQVPGSRAIRPSTPPSDYDREAMADSMERIRGTAAGRLFLPHFGEAQTGADEMIDLALESLARWHDSFEAMPGGEADASTLVERAEGDLDPAVRARFEAINPGWLNLEGMEGERRRLGR